MSQTLCPRTLRAGQRVTVELPFSEVCMHMRMAGQRRTVHVRPDGMADILDDSGRPCCGVVTWAEAGIYRDENGRPYIVTSDPLTLVIGSGYTTLRYVGTDEESRPTYAYHIDSAGGTCVERGEVKGGVCDPADLARGAAALLGFLSAAADAYRAGMAGQASENADLFTPAAMEWAYLYADEIAMLALDHEGE